MPNPIVKCTVETCTHYMPGDQCMAAKISVYNDEETAKSSSYQDTLCKSFHPGKSIGDILGGLHNANVGGAIRASFVDGKQITPQVDCFVKSCRFWEDHNHCEAKMIHVIGENAARTVDTDCCTYESR